MAHSIEKLLKDLSLSCHEIEEFINGVTLEEFKDNRMLQLAIEREFVIIGEALHRLEKVDKKNITDQIPDYRKIIGFRNIIAHGYDIIDIEAMWDFAEYRVPHLLEKINNYSV